MRFAYHAGQCDSTHYLPLAKAAEEKGFDAFSVSDSICYPQEADSEYPYNNGQGRDFLDDLPFLEPFSVIAAMAAVTTTLSFSTSVVKLPVRNPVLAAKQASTVQVLSNNRFVFGVGLSPWKEDFSICDQPWERRGSRMEDMIHIMRGLWRGDYYSHSSEFYQIPSCKLCPVPKVTIPVLLGGHANVALKRAARIADGWISAGANYQELSRMITTINNYRRDYTRDKADFQIHAIGKDAYSLDGINRLEALGVTEVIVSFRDLYKKQPDPSLEEKLNTMDWYANEIIAKAN